MKMNKKVIMFGGKGGVGKSTMSASAAMYFASRGEKTLVLSSDPAPSLSDIFGIKLGSTPEKIDENLYGMEISEQEVLKRWKEKFGKDIYEVLSSFFDVDVDIVDYIGTAPGIEEEFLLDYIMEMVKNEEYDRIIWDTAPMGHTLKLLFIPSKFIEHLNLAAVVYAKFHGKFKGRTIFDIIEEWKTLAEEVLDFLRTGVDVFVVAVPQELSVRQTERLITEFENYGIRVSKVVMNEIVTSGCCDIHIRAMKRQEKYIAELKKKYENLIEIPLMCDIERDDLMEISQKLFEGRDLVGLNRSCASC